jgi:hypothetical protein
MASQLPKLVPALPTGLSFQPLSQIGSAVSGGANAAAGGSATCNTAQSDTLQPVLTGCAAQVTDCTAKGPEKGNTLAPYVLVEFGAFGADGLNTGNKITVSNESSPGTSPPHTAIVQSFELGFSDGLGGKIVIQDTEGGSFVQFAENLFADWKCLENPVTTPQIKMQFGWVKSGCERPYPFSFSRCYYGIIDGLDTSYTEGKFIAELKIIDIGKAMTEGHVEAVKGSDDQTWCLADAIRALLTNDVSPNVGNVSFRKVEGGELVPTGFLKNDADCGGPVPDGGDGQPSITGGKGPKDKWDPKSQPKMTAAMRWIKDYNSVDKKGWRPFYDPSTPGGEIIFLADSKPHCDDAPTSFFWDKCLGHYIVNGGNESPVLEFNPKIHWDFAMLVSGGGQTGDQKVKPLPEEGSKSPGRRDCPKLKRAIIPGAGHPMAITSNEVLLNQEGANAEDEGHKAQINQFKAYRVNIAPINAELVIIGDPEYYPLKTQGKYVSITVINPFFVQKNGGQDDGGCADWNVTTINACNEVLSHPGWQVMKIMHKIELGKYTTHLTVQQAGPGTLDGNQGQHGGLWEGEGGWNNGWTPVSCS